MTETTQQAGREHPYEAGCHAALMRLSTDPTLPEFDEWVTILDGYGIGDLGDDDLANRFTEGWVQTWNNATRERD